MAELLVGIDPGLRATGVAIVERSGVALRPLALFVFETKIDKSLSRSRDHLRCATFLASCLTSVLRWQAGVGVPFAELADPRDVAYAGLFGVTVSRMCVEAMSYPPGAKSPARTSLVWGAIATLSARDGVPVEQASPQAIKRQIAGKVSASKEEVRDALHRRFGSRTLRRLLSGVRHATREHAYDALAAAVALSSVQPDKKSSSRRPARII